MIRIIDDRSTGKTSRLMLLAKENDAYFICNNPRAMEYKAKAYGIEGINFISYGEFITEYYRNGKYQHDKFVLDELEMFLERDIFPNDSLVGYTMSKE